MANETKTEMQRRFGLLVRQIREKKGLTKTAVADMIGKELQDIQQIENGKRNVTLETIIGLAVALDVPPSTFLNFEIKDFYSYYGKS